MMWRIMYVDLGGCYTPRPKESIKSNNDIFDLKGIQVDEWHEFKVACFIKISWSNKLNLSCADVAIYSLSYSIMNWSVLLQISHIFY